VLLARCHHAAPSDLNVRSGNLGQGCMLQCAPAARARRQPRALGCQPSAAAQPGPAQAARRCPPAAPPAAALRNPAPAAPLYCMQIWRWLPDTCSCCPFNHWKTGGQRASSQRPHLLLDICRRRHWLQVGSCCNGCRQVELRLAGHQGLQPATSGTVLSATCRAGHNSFRTQSHRQ
jgi:hypothetical protein